MCHLLYMSRAMRKRVMSYANNKGAEQPAHSRSLISAFVVRCLASVMSLVSVTKISSLILASIAEQASLCLTWSETPEDTFSYDEAHIYRADAYSSAQNINILCSKPFWLNMCQSFWYGLSWYAHIIRPYNKLVHVNFNKRTHTT